MKPVPTRRSRRIKDIEDKNKITNDVDEISINELAHTSLEAFAAADDTNLQVHAETYDTKSSSDQSLSKDTMYSTVNLDDPHTSDTEFKMALTSGSESNNDVESNEELKNGNKNKAKIDAISFTSKKRINKKIDKLKNIDELDIYDLENTDGEILDEDENDRNDYRKASDRAFIKNSFSSNNFILESLKPDIIIPKMPRLRTENINLPNYVNEEDINRGYASKSIRKNVIDTVEFDLSELIPTDGDNSSLEIKQDGFMRPLWVASNGRITMEAFGPLYDQAKEFLLVVAEPLSRLSHFHEYRITEFSLYAAISVGLTADGIIRTLDILSKTPIPENLKLFINLNCTTYGKVKLVLRENKYFMECESDIMNILVSDSIIKQNLVGSPSEVIDYSVNEDISIGGENFASTSLNKINETSSQAISDGVDSTLKESDDISDYDDENFQIDIDEFVSIEKQFTKKDSQADVEVKYNGEQPEISILNPKPYILENEKKRKKRSDIEMEEQIAKERELEGKRQARLKLDVDKELSVLYQMDPLIPNQIKNTIPDTTAKRQLTVEIEKDSYENVKKRSNELLYPVMEEYDFKNDTTNSTLDITLKSSIKLRLYQAKSLSKMFGNFRARSGIIVLPCGAGKTLVGVSAACTVRKSCLVLCTSSVSVEQWAREFKFWSTIQDYQIAKFTSQDKSIFQSESGVLISTYTMLSFSGKRAYDTQRVIDFITSREWGYLILDEVHVVPADMFKKVLSMVAAHAKLGLTATLVREDNKIESLNYLIGPKLYEANWLELASDGHISEVQCYEVWCPMTVEFYQEYLSATIRKKQLLFTMNPRKIQACQYLIKFHEQRGDKIIVFSDNVFALKHYANKLSKPYIYGGTNPAERIRILQQFRYNPSWSTIFLSKVGDTSIDIPEASCLIQISSHFGSRRQEAQRLGRILRSKKSGSNVAYFYSLISRDTIEAYYAGKRQRFLVDQGYSYSIVTQLKSGLLKMQEVVYSTKAEQLELLNTILVTNDMDEEFAERSKRSNDATNEDRLDSGLSDDTDEDVVPIIKKGNALHSLSGADSMAYIERRIMSTKENPWNRLSYND